MLQGAVYELAIDLRKNSSTYGKYVGVELTEDNKRQFFIPRGFAHGFQVLSEKAVFTYKVDNKYAPEAECSIRYDDKAIAINWPLADVSEVLLSKKDLERAVSFDEADKF